MHSLHLKSGGMCHREMTQKQRGHLCGAIMWVTACWHFVLLALFREQNMQMQSNLCVFPTSSKSTGP